MEVTVYPFRVTPRSNSIAPLSAKENICFVDRDLMNDTGSLLNKLNNAKQQKDLDKHLDSIDGAAARGYGAYLKQYLAEHDISVADMSKAALLDRSYCYQIIKGTKNPGRDKIISIALASGMDMVHTQRGLEIAGEGILYSKSRRDSVLIYAVNNKMSVISANALLEEYGEFPLD